MFRLAVLAGVATLALTMLVGGCAATPRSDEYGHRSELPWNLPQGWEGSPMLPGFDRQ